MKLSNFFSSMIRCQTRVSFLSGMCVCQIPSFSAPQQHPRWIPMMWVRCATGCLYIQVFSHKINAKLTTLLPPATPGKEIIWQGMIDVGERVNINHHPFPLTSRWFSQSFNSISFCIHVDQRDLRTRGDFASHRPPEVRWRCAGNQFAIRGYHDIQARLKWPSIRVSLCWLLPQDTTCFSKYRRQYVWKVQNFLLQCTADGMVCWS